MTTTKQQHTPGPWWMAATESRPTGAYVIGAGDEELAGFARREDALLAASAPDLLAALELAERNANSRLYMLPVDSDVTERKSIYSELMVYRAAIAKARGESK